jgi:hypothetical protein
VSQVGRDDPAGDGHAAIGRWPEADQEAQQAMAVQVMTTEHFTLQTARGAATTESSSRSALFLTVLSAALVAIALAAQVTTPDHVLLLALLALGVVFFLGLVTYLRVLENGIEDYLYVKEINRIRHFYVEVAPETAPYFRPLLSRRSGEHPPKHGHAGPQVGEPVDHSRRGRCGEQRGRWRARCGGPPDPHPSGYERHDGIRCCLGRPGGRWFPSTPEDAVAESRGRGSPTFRWPFYRENSPRRRPAAADRAPVSTKGRSVT